MTELATSVTIARDGRIWINGKIMPFHLDPTGSVIAAGSQPTTRVAVLPILLFADAIVMDLRDGDAL